MDNDIIADIRQFNRYYTDILGLLNRSVLDTGYSLTEARVIIEIGLMEQCIANNLVDLLNIDRSYMSRIIRKLKKDGLIFKEKSSSNSRTNLIRLSSEGITLFNEINKKSDEQLVELFQGLSRKQINEIHASMLAIKKNLDSLERK
ncbi:transcriptional regulator [Bacillus sp. FJAT-27264]|uniref:MarR family winged helix-turn-helix transcriptional regulator n=1 Tax=Paenibacillus sp. (strain DSM 101736 / FJAT-27264) TaxID=1850362 RepID=UPI0008080CAE|nr:MarR family winged helix-turn-helix transcriptional regulator [Bacillus sp. FJAT-27264]OBZ19352.1 transcriptional regulator [Bacillus sp. FJAT-27264]